MRKLLATAVDSLWAAFAAVLIAAAALVTVVRLLLPEIGTQRDQIAAWISDTVGRPAMVGDIEASWSGWAPRISVRDIAFLDPARSSELVRFERATINIAPLGSLFSGSLKPKSLILSGVALTLLRHEDGRFTVAGMPPPKAPIIKWLARQDSFAITEADLTIIDQRRSESFALADLALTVRDRDGRKTIAGNVALPAAIGRRLSFSFRADGDPLGQDWDGNVDFRLEGIHSSYLATQFGWRDGAPPAARIDVDGWSRWQDARLHELRFDLTAHTDATGPADAAPLLSMRALLSRRARGWRLDVADIALPRLARGTVQPRFSAAWHREDGVAQALALRGEGLPLEPLALLAAGLAPLDPRTRDRLHALGTSGTARTLSAAWLRHAAPEATWFADAELERVASDSHGAWPGVSGLDTTVSVRRDGGRVAFQHAAFKLAHDRRLVETVDVDALDGSLTWRRRPDGSVDLAFDTLRGEVEGLAFALTGSVEDALGEGRSADLALDVPHAAAARVHHLIPHDVLPPRGEQWVRHVLAGGRLADGRMVLRGPLARFPFRAGEGTFALDFDVVDGELEYSTRWPAAHDVQGRVSARGARIAMQVEKADVRGATISSADIVMPDLFVRERLVTISGSARGPAGSATAIVMSSPLRRGRAARLAEVDIGGDIEVALDMNIALYPGGPREVLGQARLDGNRIEAPKLRIALDDVSGTVSFTRGDWYGEGLTATFEGTPVGLVVNGGLDDPNYDSEFRMTGTSPAARVLAYLQRFSPPLYGWLASNRSLDALQGELPWKAVLTLPTASADGTVPPRRLSLESTLAGLDVDLPWPFGKRSAERKPLRVDLALDQGIALATRIDFGDTLDAEIAARRGADGRAVIERVEVQFGTLAPHFTGAPGITLGGYIAQLPLSEWTGFLSRAAPRRGSQLDGLPLRFDVQVSELALLGQRLADVRLRGTRDATAWNVTLASLHSNGRVVVPRNFAAGTLVIDLDSLRLDKPQDLAAGNDPPDPRRIPPLELSAGTFAFGDVELGSARISTRRRDDGLVLERLEFRDAGFSLDAGGEWRIDGNVQSSHFRIDVDAASLAGLLDRFGYSVANIEAGDTQIGIDAHWPGTPADFRLEQLDGSLELHVADGRFLDIEPGGGRLFGLLSLQALPRRLSLDFDDLFGKGFAFDRIDGEFELDRGNAYTNSLLLDGPAARIDVSGRTGLTDKDYDQHVVVTPALSSSIPVAGALFGPIGVGAGAVYFLGQKMFKSIPEQINRFLSREYQITGSWENPSIERI